MLNILKQSPFSIYRASTTLPGDCRTFTRHKSPHCTVEFVLEGEGTVIIDDQRFSVSANDIYILPRHHYHQLSSKPRNTWRKTFFSVEGTFMDTLLELYGLTGNYYFKSCPCELEDKFNQIRDLFTWHKPGFSFTAAIIAHEIISELCVLSQGQGISLSEHVRTIKTMLDQSLNQKIDLDSICVSLRCSKSQLIRLFKRETGMTPYDYLLSIRLESAKSLLKYGSMRIQEIAHSLCFSDPYHFSAFFKKKTGISPREFRNQAG